MSDHETDRISRLERLVAEQQRLIEALLARGGAEVAAAPATVATAPVPDSVNRRDVLRRALLTGGAVVAGSAALAMADTAPAAAAPSSPSLVAAGQTTTDATTVVYGPSAGSAYPHGILAVTDTTFDASAPEFGWGGAINGYGGPVLQIGVSGYGDFTGVRARSVNGTGLFALGATGVHAESTTGPAVSAVGGTASATAAISASTRGTGSALEAISANASPAIYTKAGTGSALRADGPVVVNGSSSFNGATTFSRSGTAVVAGTRRKPRRAVAVTGVNVSKHSRVLATIQGDAGAIGISGVIVNPSKHSLTINLTGRVTRSVAITWLVLG